MFKKYIQKIILATKDWQQNGWALGERSYGFSRLHLLYTRCPSALTVIVWGGAT